MNCNMSKSSFFFTILSLYDYPKNMGIQMFDMDYLLEKPLTNNNKIILVVYHWDGRKI